MKEQEKNIDPDIRIERINFESENPPSCCFCMDVRIGTVLIGLFYMIVHSLWLVAATAKAMRQRYFDHEQLSHYLSEFDRLSEHHRVNHHIVGMVLASLCFIVVLLLVYGAALRIPNYILPFFCLQIFDMSLTIMMAVSMISYAPSVKLYLENMEALRGQHYTENMSMAHFNSVLITVWLIVLTVKYFMISVVWDCYKHSKVHQERCELHRNMNIPKLLVPAGYILPTYDEAIKEPPAYNN